VPEHAIRISPVKNRELTLPCNLTNLEEEGTKIGCTETEDKKTLENKNGFLNHILKIR